MRIFGCCAAAGLLVAGVHAAQQAPPPTAVQTAATPAQVASAAPADGPVRPVVDRYCVTCHNDRTKTAGLSLQGLDLTQVPQNAEIWEKVIRKVASGAMPPVGMPRPEPAAATAMVTWLAGTLDRAAEARPDPGRPLLHRLNRAEYGNAIRDLLDLQVDAAALLPPDDATHGFDNVADNLNVSPVLLERYLAAAGKVSALAVGDPDTAVDGVTYLSRPDSHQLEHVEGLPEGTRGGLRIERTFPLDGEYEISTRLYRTNGGFIRGLVYPHEVEFSVDGERVFIETIGTRADYEAILANPASANSIDDRLKVRVPIKAGPRVIGVTFLDRTNAVNPILLKPLLGAGDPVDADGVPRIDTVLISGPYNPTGPGDTPSRRRIFSCTPSKASEATCARTIVSTLARRAFRRPVTATELEQLMSFYTMGRERRGTFEGGIQLALRRVLADPAFIFRVEKDPANLAAGTAYRVNDLELASRLSFFLWSSLPDEELVTAATQGRLRNQAELRRQVRRMIADPRADALTANFAGQWLQLRNLSASSPDPTEFPNFDDPLRKALRRETELLFENVMRNDRSVIELLTADYTFLNERLAKHYGVAGIYGSRFRRVPVTDDARRGLLGHGSILTITSYPNRTSPVKRGKWILENIIGSPPPPPPPNVPPLPAKDANARPKTMREQMETHRANPTCATCHRLMDPLGFAMENFDAVGAWRVRDTGRNSIDSSAQLADGTKVGGVVELRNVLLARPEAFAQTVTQNLMVYATGRGLRAADMPAVRKILRNAAGSNYQFSALVQGVVESVPFQMRTTLGAGEKETLAAR